MQKNLITTAIDDAYVYPLLVMAFSLKKNITCDYTLLIGYDRKLLSPTNLEVIRKFMKHFGIKFDFYELEIPSEWPESHHISAMTFSKLIFATNLSQKFIWIDVDVLIRGSVNEIIENFDEFIGPENICARLANNTPRSMKEESDISAEQRYFNAGILLIDAKKWAESHDTLVVLKYILEGLDWLDQGVFNKLAAGYFSELPIDYNYFVGQDEFFEEIKIAHFLGDLKPWKIPRNKVGKSILLNKKRIPVPYIEYDSTEREIERMLKGNKEMGLVFKDLRRKHSTPLSKVLKRIVRIAIIFGKTRK
jgi:lipopolysaccharide biosynthesis glycosyltransferase